jgi:hypothetical protein
MKFKFQRLTLQCKQAREVIDLSSQVSFFYGKISAGKSSIARLIEFCFGGNLEKTSAINQELISVDLEVIIGQYTVLLERNVQSPSMVQVTWKNEVEETWCLSAPIQAQQNPIWNDNIYNLSDLIFYFSDIIPLKVHRSKTDSTSPLIRLSFRDLFWYCYLQQDLLDSSFYRLEEKETFRKLKSRDVMRFIVGYYNEKLNQLEIQLEETKQQRLVKQETIKQIKNFLRKFDYASELEIIKKIEQVNQNLDIALLAQRNLREEYKEGTHFVDDLRDNLRQRSERLNSEKQTLEDLREKIEEQESLKAELLSTKFKLAQVRSAADILSEILFEFCPACGTEIEDPSYSEDTCYLCGKHPSPNNYQAIKQTEVIQQDIMSRIVELDESISRHKKSIHNQRLVIQRLQEEKANLDQRLAQELENYDSSFLARFREIEREIATYEERQQNLNKLREMTEAITQLERESHELLAQEMRIENLINQEKSTLKNAEQNIRDLENNFLQALLTVGVPGVNAGDSVEINIKTWMPYIYPNNDKALKWNFENAGSGGKKTLLNVCYALAVHQTSSENNLPLPTFLIIDTPMKNIGEELDSDLFEQFYNYLYNLANTVLKDTQFIIIDKNYYEPPQNYSINISSRRMTPNDDNYPPLITYYRGS